MRAPRARTVVLGAALGSLALACAAGCEAVPDIRFVDEDGGSSGGPDSGLDGRTDGPSGDASTSCLAPSPGEGATCCGKTWCTPGATGACTAATCAACEAAPCATGDLCCAKPQGALCKKTCQ